MVHADHLLKIKNEFRNFKKQNTNYIYKLYLEIQIMFTKANLIRLVFNMI